MFEPVMKQYPLARFNGTYYNGASQAYVRADADNCIVCPMQRIARQLIKHGVPT